MQLLTASSTQHPPPSAAAAALQQRAQQALALPSAQLLMTGAVLQLQLMIRLAGALLM
jgi:hypothetical protein